MSIQMLFEWDEAKNRRWQTIGRMRGIWLVLVAYSVTDEGEEVLRVFPARRANRQERTEYEEANEI